jgi:hypothetical protein
MILEANGKNGLLTCSLRLAGIIGFVLSLLLSPLASPLSVPRFQPSGSGSMDAVSSGHHNNLEIGITDREIVK